MNVIVIGYYGANLGDLGMLRVFLEFASRRKISVTIFTYSKSIELIHDIASGIPVFPLRGLLDPSVLAALRRADAIVWGGGTCLMDEGGTGGLKYMALAKILGKKVFYVGIGIGRAQQLRTRLLIRMARAISTRITVRDERSQYLLGDAGCSRVKRAPDLIYGLSTPAPRRVGRRLLISYRSLAEFETAEKQRGLLISFANCVQRAVSDHAFREVKIIDADDEVDGADSAELCEMLPGSCHLRRLAFHEKLEQIASADFVLTARLHVAMLAYISGTPFVLLDYSPKNRAFLEDISQTERLWSYEQLSGQIPARLLAASRSNDEALVKKCDVERALQELADEIL